MLSQAMINSIGLLALSTIATFLATHYWHKKSRDEKIAEAIKAEHDKLVEKVRVLEQESALVKAAVVPITTAFQALLIKELTHFHTPELDALLAKVGPPTALTADEEARMFALLAERVVTLNGEIDESEREAAQILPPVMRRAKVEQSKIEQDSVLAVVSVPKDQADVLPGRRSEDPKSANGGKSK